MKLKLSAIPKPMSVPSSAAIQVQARFQQALALHQKGQGAQAQALYEAILKDQPRHCDALHLLGVIAYDARDFHKAVELIGKAIDICQNNAAFYSNRGNALKELKQFDAAIASYDNAIALKPDFAQAYYNRGNALKELKQPEAAIASYNKAIDHKPDWPEAYTNRGVALQELKHLDASIESFNQAIAIKPDFAQAYYNRGNALWELQRADEAIESFTKATLIRPDFAQAYCNRGLALQSLGQLDAALESFEQALALRPDDAQANYNRGVALLEHKQIDAALESFDRALALQPDYAQAHYNRGVVLQERSQLDAAVASYDKAIEIRPNLAQAHWNKSLALLLAGDYQRGWELFEWRWIDEKTGLTKRNFPQALWLGKESLVGKTILLHSEQGLGDTIQFCRYAKLASDMGARVIMEVDQSLIDLFKGLAGVAELVVKGTPLPPFDFHCPLLSLPLAFNTTLDSIPCPTKYLCADSGKVAYWANKLGTRVKPRVGLVWSSTSSFKGDSSRSVNLSEFIAALPTHGFDFVCLQKELKAADKCALASRTDIRFFGDALNDFSDTAALIECVDLVISTCTSVPHLSSALGKSTWILLAHVPDWRWLLTRSDSPWYSAARLYRQASMGDWGSVFAKVKTDLARIGVPHFRSDEKN